MGVNDIEQKKNYIRNLTSLMFHKHYCENDIEFLLQKFSDDVIWIGTGEKEWAYGAERVVGIFRKFAGQIPKCVIYEEEYQVQAISSEAFLCSGRAWITTDPSTGVYLRVHQRITLVFRWKEESPECTHIHISNPYDDMVEEDIGFPNKVAYQSYQYMQEQLELQREKNMAQTEELQKMSYQDMLTGVYNRNKFITIINAKNEKEYPQLGIAYFDLNELKNVNDQQGHSAGDDLIRSMAAHLWQVFEGKVYRTGGDEFIVIEKDLSEDEFKEKISAVKKTMREEGISFAVGISWRYKNCSIKEQYEEADKSMYKEKRLQRCTKET